MQLLRGHRSPIKVLAFHGIPGTPVLLSHAGREKRISLWDLTSGKRVYLTGFEHPVSSIHCEPNGDGFAATNNRWTLFRWRLDAPTPVRLGGHSLRLGPPLFQTFRLTWFPDGPVAVFRSTPRRDTRPDCLLPSDWGKTEWVLSGSVVDRLSDDPNGRVTERYLLNCCHVSYSLEHGDRTLSIFGWWKLHPMLTGGTLPSQAPRSFAPLPDSSGFLIGQQDGTIRLFASETGESIASWKFDIGPVKSLAVSPDGSLFAAGGERTIVVWNADD